MKKLLFISLSMFLVLSLCLNIGIYAGTTGKIQGTVTDSESREALPGVNVVVEGTSFGAAVDENGFFFILNVPPGTYRLKATMVGYAVETKEDVRVFVDRTTPVNFLLKTEAVAGEEVTVTAERVAVPLDVSSTEAYISGVDITESATTRFDELIGLQAGVSFSSDAKQGEGFSVRGGAVQETDVQIDGMTVMNELTRIPTTAISRNLIQDVQILTGGFNAEYGNVRSGLINVVTKDGSYNRYSGILEGRYRPAGFKHYGDYGPFSEKALVRRRGAHRGVLGGSSWDDVGINNVGDEAMSGWNWTKQFYQSRFLEAAESRDADGNLVYDAAAGQAYIDSHPYNSSFVGWNKTAAGKDYNAASALDIYRWIHRPKDYGNDPDLYLDVSGGGPVPIIPNTKFYASSIWNKANFTIPTSRNYSTEMTNSLKLTTRLKSNMILVGNFVYSYVGSTGSDNINSEPSVGYVPGDRVNVGWIGMLYADSRYTPKTNDNYFGSLQFTHTYSPSTYYDLTIGVQRGFNKAEHVRLRDRSKIKFIDDPDLAAAGWKETILQYTGTGDEWTSEGGATYDKVDAGLPAGRIGLDESPRGFFINGASNSVDGWNDQINAFSNGNTQTNWNHNQNTTITVKGNFVSQVNKYNQIKAGFEFNSFHVNRRGFQRSWGPIYSYDETTTFGLWNFITYKADPREFEAFIQDKLEWEGMIVNFGLRATYWDPNTNGFDINDNNRYSGVWNSHKVWGNVVGEGNWKFRNQRTRKINTKILLQPRLGVSHPITESSKIFFNYGHFYQRPTFKNMYWVGSTFRAGGSPGGNGTGNVPVPDIPWPRTVSYEIGYSQSIYDQLLLQISGYYKDYTNEYTRLTSESYYGDIWYRTGSTNRYRDVRGLEFRVERTFGRFVNFWANYNYMIQSEGNTGLRILYEDMTKLEDQWYNFGQTRAEALPNMDISLTLRTPVGFGPGPSILGVKPLAEWRANIIISWRDGGEFVDDANLPPRDWNYVQRINRQMYNFYLQKRIASGADFYLQVNNIFNIKYFSPGTGYGQSLRYPWTDPEGNDKYGEWDKYHINTYSAGDDWDKWEYNKRAFYFGVRYQF